MKVTKEWKRYWTSGVLPAKCHKYSHINLELLDEGTIWVDAIQLEQGDEPTTFEN